MTYQERGSPFYETPLSIAFIALAGGSLHTEETQSSNATPASSCPPLRDAPPTPENKALGAVACKPNLMLKRFLGYPSVMIVIARCINESSRSSGGHVFQLHVSRPFMSVSVVVCNSHMLDPRPSATR